MKRWCILLSAVATIIGKVAAQEMVKDSLKIDNEATKGERTANLLLFLKTSAASDSGKGTAERAYLNVDEARVGLMGAYGDRLSYFVRFRLNRPMTPDDVDNASRALDFAFLTYQIGERRQWEVTLGKQVAQVGSWETDSPFLREFFYTDYLNYYSNVFVTAATLARRLGENHSLRLQVHNTLNSSFASHLKANGYVGTGFEAPETPLGLYLAWAGQLGRFQTLYSYNISQFAKGYYTHTLSLGNQYKADRWAAYIDLVYSDMGVDFALLPSNLINEYKGAVKEHYLLQEGIVYKTAVARYDQQLTPRWSFSLKGSVETSGSRKELSENLRYNYQYVAVLQYAPLSGEDLQFFASYVGNTLHYSSLLNKPDSHLNHFAIGLYYKWTVLKSSF